MISLLEWPSGWFLHVYTCFMLQSCTVVTLQDGRTALHWAALRGHTAALKVLVAAGAGLNIADLVSYIIIYFHLCTIVTCGTEVELEI